jgi:hypothetical protein
MRNYNPFRINLQGDLNLRSQGGNVPETDFSVRQNISFDKGKPRRMGGWQRLFVTESDDDYNNEDLHDTTCGLGSVSFTSATFDASDFDGGRINYVFEALSPTGGRSLVACTTEAVYAYSPTYQNWRFIAWGKGGESGTQKTWRADQVGRYTVLTNNFNEPIVWDFDLFPDEDTGQAATEIADLQSLNITRAKCVCEYRGYLFFGNIEQDGVRQPTRLLWSDFQNPLAFDPSITNSDGSARLSGIADLDNSGEAILAMEKIGDFLIIYREKSIWRVIPTGDDTILFQFEELYSGENSLYYPNTLVDIGGAHAYMGQDDIFIFDLSSRVPQRIAYIHKASPVIYDDIKNDCEHAVGGYDEERNEIWFSWSKAGDADNAQTLILNTLYQKIHTVDHGFSAFRQIRTNQWPSIESWLLNNSFCCPSDFTLSNLTLQGDRRNELPAECSPIGPAGMSFNDQDAALCTALAGKSIEDFCSSCPDEPVFVMASVGDGCLKQYNSSYAARQRHTTGFTYVEDGYESKIAGPAIRFGTDKEKVIGGVEVDLDADGSESPAVKLYCVISVSEHYDIEARRIVDEGIPSKDLVSPWLQSESRTPSTLRPNTPINFPCFRRGRYLFYELKWGNDSGTLRTGGVCTWSGITLWIRQAER